MAVDTRETDLFIYMSYFCLKSWIFKTIFGTGKREYTKQQKEQQS